VYGFDTLRRWIAPLGAFGWLQLDTVRAIVQGKVNPREVCRQIVFIGVNSLGISSLTALFTGMVLALQTAYGLERFGAKHYVGNVAGLAFIRELGPMLTAVVLCGRVGAGIAAEIASMVVTEQVDAMTALGADPVGRLVAPRVIAGIIATPLLVIFANLIGIYGGLAIAVFELNVSAHVYFQSLYYTILIRDILDSLVKSGVFGFIVASVACFQGLRARGGTEGVGRTTTSAVVIGCVWIFVADFFVTKMLLLL
jgi:phospholipid/cholesterol/gamma-HCH transport system permease protein